MPEVASSPPGRHGADTRPQDWGSNLKTRTSWAQRQPVARRAAHATAASREGSSSTVKPASSGGAQGYPPSATVPSADTSAALGKEIRYFDRLLLLNN